MMTSEDLANILRSCNQIDNVFTFDQDADSLPYAVAETTLPYSGKQILLLFELPEKFPNVLPRISLVSVKEYDLLPHVIRSGYVCYLSLEGGFIDKMNPTSTILESFQMAVDTLDQGVSGENKWELISEFEAYWNYSVKDDSKTFVELSNSIKQVKCSEFKTFSDDKKTPIYYDDLEDVTSYFNLEDISILPIQKAVYIPFPPGTFCEPPKFGEKWSLSDFRKLINDNLEPAKRKAIKRLLRGKKRDDRVLFMIPRMEYGKALFGVKFTNIIGEDHPLFSNRSSAEIIPIVLKRYDKEYLLPRGGANQTLSGKKVAIIGCGAVGGYLALDLVRAGILNITLVDDDQIKPENVYRHVLGKYGFGKAYSLKNKIEKELPFTNIQYHGDRLETILKDGSFISSEFDLLIFAIGDDTLCREFNEKLHSIINPPILYVWVEGYDIGGHILVTNLDRKPGCFECLITAPSGEIVSNRAAFIRPGQVLTKDFSGCGSKFMPYGSYTAQKTALEASRISVNVLLGNINSHSLYSWKGDDQELKKQGFQTSERYKLSQEQLDNQKDEYIVSSCRICGNHD